MTETPPAPAPVPAPTIERIRVPRVAAALGWTVDEWSRLRLATGHNCECAVRHSFGVRSLCGACRLLSSRRDLAHLRYVWHRRADYQAGEQTPVPDPDPDPEGGPAEP